MSERTARGLPAIGPFAALQFLTRIPLRLRSAPDLAASAPWFPAVGCLIGAAVGGVVAGLAELVPPAVAAAIGVLFGVAVTGAFHEDGLADTADAMGGWTPDRRREILKDSRHGSYGVAALCGTIVLRIVCLASVGPAVAFAGSVAAHGLGRAGAVSVMATAPPVPAAGLGAEYTRVLSPTRAWLGVLAAVGVTALATGWWVGPLALATALGAIAIIRLAVRAFEGVGGDQLGAAEQVGECLVLVVVSGLALHHDLWWA